MFAAIIFLQTGYTYISAEFANFYPLKLLPIWYVRTYHIHYVTIVTYHSYHGAQSSSYIAIYIRRCKMCNQVHIIFSIIQFYVCLSSMYAL